MLALQTKIGKSAVWQHHRRTKMSVRQHGKIIAGTSVNPCLFDHKWADHILNDVSWLRADTFSWQDGSIYEAAYNHLAADISGKSLTSETVSGITIQFYVADDGHKICPASEESNVASIFSATGIAWYYIIDTTNQKFKLPRTQYGFSGIRTTVGKYIEAGLPNITGNIWSDLSNNVRGMQGFGANGAFVVSATGWTQYFERWGDRTGASTISLNASYSSSIYGNSDTVQPKATEQYLYFYVGNFTQTAVENTAGLNAELFNGKVDIGHQVIAFQAPTAANNYTWYRKYADGWVEQGGIVDYGSLVGGSARSSNVTFPVVMKDTHYQVLAGYKDADSGSDYALNCGYNPNQFSTAGFRLTTWTTDSGMAYRYVFWQASGMAA